MDTTRHDNAFTPPCCLRNPMLQTFLNSAGIRNRGANPLTAAEEEMILDLGEVRLQGFLSRRNAGKGTVILLHGWEGSATSAYVLHTGRYLFEAGYDVFRLNLRDHGDTHHLNRGVFMGTLIDEMYAALKAVARIAGGASLYLAGFSMGANFIVRAAARFAGDPIPNLKKALAINPPIDPMHATKRIDEITLIRLYFIKKWKASLARKQALFPDLYDFNDILKIKTCMGITDMLIERYLPYRNAAEYFSKFTLAPELLAAAELPMTIIISEDDPIIPASGFRALPLNANTRLIVQRYGGHCGYIMDLSMKSWYFDRMVEIFN
jgi:predicted alpha/beta-fold hydrolase